MEGNASALPNIGGGRSDQGPSDDGDPFDFDGTDRNSFG
jgi:hypothetical protein